MPPSLLATVLLLQSHDKVSNAEAKARANFDLWWKVALGIEAEDRPFVKRTLQMLKSRLSMAFQPSADSVGIRCLGFKCSWWHPGQSNDVSRPADTARQGAGGVRGEPAVGPGVEVSERARDVGGAGYDQHPGPGRGEGHLYNLLADGIVKLLRALAAVEQAPIREWAQAWGYHRYLGSSMKGEVAIDWADWQAWTALLFGIMADADRLLEWSRQGGLGEDSTEHQRIVVAA